jgi:nucleoside-diphosphate-sugar epimerase
MYLVTGGAGFFGEILIRQLLDKGEKVRCFDINIPTIKHKNLEVIKGNILDKKKLKYVVDGVDIVHHNVAQVPIQKNKIITNKVNKEGTLNILNISLRENIKHFVYTSSSAVYGIPNQNPITENSIRIPIENYGSSKLSGELLCEEFRNKGLSCSIIRPRTILGPGRLGIFQILFEWIYLNLNVPVIDNGDNIFQFVHAKDLASACIYAGDKYLNDDFNVGAEKFGSLRKALENLVNTVGSKSKIKSVPSFLSNKTLKILNFLRFSPLSTYHAEMYGRDIYFDVTKSKKFLNFSPEYSNDQMFVESYEWYVKNRKNILFENKNKSAHQSMLKQKVLKIIPYII